MDQPGNGLDYDLAECLYNRFQYSSMPYNSMLNSKTSSSAPTSLNGVNSSSVAKVTGSGGGVGGSSNTVGGGGSGKQNSSQLAAGSNGSSASASSPTSTISSCSSSTNKSASNGATKNSVSPVSSHQQQSADISPRSIKSSCSLEAKANDVAIKAEDLDDDKKSKAAATAAFNESFSDSQLSMDNNNGADESGTFSPRVSRSANLQDQGKESSELEVVVSEEMDGEGKAEAQNDSNNEKGDEDRKSRSHDKITSGNSYASPISVVKVLSHVLGIFHVSARLIIVPQ